ncbi:lytic transglycosylase domain-containing protein [Marinifilum caeruleilacunae]|uniref:LysM peptidoglycan-binding domain-containing protein n=1 Tax=Marinifilum caeruleilacunae TaxID=2499076 RepID=A0ABX1X0J1_9BACT|nr:lytic transglycosylase domain-containing protein [Marinifilum caeruleilacunae]NOU61624.1 LysM peptidoglycan-binding domain-containing protein [Marinifilum caeruleilacunae]
MKNFFLLLLISLLGSSAVSAQSLFRILQKEKPENAEEINQRLIYFTDEILKEELPENEILNANYIPVFSDEIYRERMQRLDDQTPIELDYQPVVRRFIEAYAVRHREKTGKIIERSELYFPIFEECLDKYDLPLELKYLSVIESALDPKARSRSGAIGLWQFMYNSCKMFDLRVTSYVDERMDPEKSTEAACKYLQYLHRIFGDWQLAIAAYNGGPGVVREAIQRSGGKTDFWEIAPYLPQQTRNYVPIFIAANYIMNYSREHNIVAKPNQYPYFRVSPVKVKKKVSFKHVAAVIDVPVEEIRKLNPIYKRDVIPTGELPAQIVLPVEKIGLFIDREEEIYAMKDQPKKYLELQKELSSTKGKYPIYHEVQAGEYFHKIAMKYSCTTHNIMKWNNMKSQDIYIGQRLKIWVEPSENISQKPQRDPLMKKSKFLLYEVQDGDSLQSIATRFKVESVKDLVEVNNMNQAKVVEPGMVLKIVQYE